MRKRILLVDDHAGVRFGLTQLINRQADLVACRGVENASGALAAIARSKPEWVAQCLFPWRMWRGGFAATAPLLQQGTERAGAKQLLADLAGVFLVTTQH